VSEQEAAVIEAAVEWVERIPDDSWPGAWASNEDGRLILAVQALTGDARWPTLAATYAPADPGRAGADTPGGTDPKETP
jgi:hypothetical protein